MGFKKWPIWLKGGIIGFILPLISYPFGYSPLGKITGLLIAPGFFIGKFIFGDPTPQLIESGEGMVVMSGGVSFLTHFSLLISPFFWAIVGLIIGLIYGKIKSRKESAPSVQ